MSEYLKEEWKPLDVEDCGYRFSISSYGRVYDNHREKFVSQVLTGKPRYFYVNLVDGRGKRLLRRVHNLMAKVFFGTPEGDATMVDHIDQNRYNNCLDNLRWVSRKDNLRNMKSNLSMNNGELILDRCEKMGLPFHKVSHLYYMGGTGMSPQECFDSVYENYFVTFQGKRQVRDYVESLIGLPKKYITTYLENGYSYDDIYEKQFKYILEEKSYPLSVECLGYWYPSKKVLCSKFGLSTDTLNKRLLEGETIDQAVSIRKNIEYKGIMYHIEELVEISGHNEELLRDRLYSKQWTVDKAVETPLLKVKFYLLNGERMTKKAMLERLGIQDTKRFNSIQSKRGCCVKKLLIEKYGIDLTDHTIIPA